MKHTASVLDRLLEVMRQHPYLTDFGIGIYLNGRDLSPADRLTQIEKNHEDLIKSLTSIEWCVDWLSTNVEHIRSINTKRSSYGLKHIAEKFHPQGYITNGVFIAAAFIVGYRYDVIRGGPNVRFGMSERSIKALDFQGRKKVGLV